MMHDLLIDVDGVVADFVQGILRAVGSSLKPEDITKWDIRPFLTPEQREDMLAVQADPDFWRSLPVKDLAKEGMKLLEATYKVTWVTSPWVSCEGWESARRDWLNEHFDMTKKGQNYIPTSAKEMVDGDVFFDDKPDNIKRWKTRHFRGRAYIFDAPYNRDFEWDRVSWHSILTAKESGGGQR